MDSAPEHDADGDLVGRLDHALEAVWRGDSVAFDRLLDDEDRAGPGVGDLLAGVAAADPCGSAVVADAFERSGYVIRREIGRGGMGVVYEALQEGTGRDVALKVLLAGPFASDPARRRFDREVRLAARLVHPNIVRILEGGRLVSGQQYYAMELVEGVSLDRHLLGARPERSAILRLFATLCDALRHAHGQGVVHRDLKPGNVLIDAGGEPHILDFGLAKATDSTDAGTLAVSLSAPGQVLGTLHYLSPEQAAGASASIDARTDVYALGVMLFQALIGVLPFDTTGRASEVMQRIAEAPPHRPSSLVKGIGGDLEAILLKALEKEPDRRYSSASALGDDLRRTLSGEAIMARRPSRVYAVRRKLRKHRWRIAMAAAVVAVSSLAVWGALSWQERAAERQHERDSVEARSKARYEAIRLQRALESGRVESALGPARTLASNHQDLPEARFVWIQAQYRMGRSGDDDDLIHAAIAQLKERVERGPSPWAYRDLLAEVVDETGGRLPAELLAREIPASPDTADAWFLRSLATLDLLVANAHLHEALDRDPRHLAARERLAYVCLLTGDYDGALAAAEALSASAEDARWPLLPAEVLMRGEQYGEAVVRLTEVIALDSSPLAHRYRAVAHLCLGDYEAAIDDYSRAAELRPRGDMWSRYGRATPLWITGYLERAAEDYRAVREARSAVTYADVRLFFVLHDLADHLEGRGLPDEAASRRAEAEAVLTTGREGVAAGSWLSKIIACLAGALAPEDLVAGTAASNPEQACEALYYAGEAQRLGGRPEEARALFRQCVETGLALDPNSGAVDPMNEYHLARWRFQAGERGSR